MLFRDDHLLDPTTAVLDAVLAGHKVVPVPATTAVPKIINSTVQNITITLKYNSVTTLQLSTVHHIRVEYSEVQFIILEYCTVKYSQNG